MTVLVVGLSHRSAPVDVLERAAVAATDVPKLVERDAARRARLGGDARLDVQPRRGLRGGRRVPRRPRRRLRRAGAAHRHGVARAHRARLRPLRGLGRAAPLRGGGGARLDGRRRGADPRPAPRRLLRRGGCGHGRARAARARPTGAARRQAGARRHRHRHGGRLRRLRGPRRRHARPRRARGAARGDRRCGRDGRAGRGAPAPRRGRRDRRAQPHARQGRAARRDQRRARHARPRGHAGRRSPPRSRPPTCWWRARARSARSVPVEAVVARDGRPLAVCDLGLPHDVDPAVADAAGRPLDRPGHAADAGSATVPAASPWRARRSWWPGRRRPTSRPSAPPRSRPRSPRCAAAPPT